MPSLAIELYRSATEPNKMPWISIEVYEREQPEMGDQPLYDFRLTLEQARFFGRRMEHLTETMAEAIAAMPKIRQQLEGAMAGLPEEDPAALHSYEMCKALGLK